MTITANKDLYLVEAGPDRLAFRKPTWLRVLFGMVGAAFVGLMLRTAFVSEQNPWVIVPCCVLGLPIVLVVLYQSGPDDIAFDLSRRTYRQRLPWPYQRRTGSFEDIDGFRIVGRWMSVWRINFDLCLVLNRPGRHWWFPPLYAEYPMLGNFGTLEEARAQAQEIAAVLGVPAKVSTDLAGT